MEVIKRTREVEEIIAYEAADGTRFSSAEECEKYEQSAQVAIYNGFIGLSVDGKPFVETAIWDRYGYGSEEWEMLVIEIKDENDLKIANMFAEMQEPEVDNIYTNRFKPEHIGKRLLVSIGSQYESRCYIWGTEEDVVERFKKDIAPFFNPKKEGENNE